MENSSQDNLVTVRKELRRLYGESRETAFFDWAGGFKNDVSATTIDRIERELRRADPNLSRSEVIEFCKQLTGLGCGIYKVGRHGRPSRMEWLYTLRSIGAVACGQSDDLESREADAPGNTDSSDRDEKPEHLLVRVEVPLSRGAARAILQIPRSLTAEDIESIYEMIQKFEVD